MGFHGGSEVKASACNAGDVGPITGSRRFPGEGNGNPPQYSCLENPMGGGAWWTTVHGVEKSRTRLSDFTFIFPDGSEGKEPTCNARDLDLIPGLGRSLKGDGQPTPVLLPGESHGQRSLWSMGSQRVGHD